MSSKDSSRGPRICIIGAGVGGLIFAINLKRQLGYENYVIYEKASDVGGTWRDNMYPGCSSDVGIHFYSLSSDLKPDWNFSHGMQPQIQGYWRELSYKYDVYSHLVVNTRATGAEWDDTRNLWVITTQNVVTNETSVTEAEILVPALGILEIPRLPDIPGLEKFKGKKFHSIEWDSEYDLKHKKVAVIGNGASATQFVPIIASEPTTEIVEFCRTPNWYLPPMRYAFTGFDKWCFRYVPFYMWFTRFKIFLTGEVFYWSIFGTRFCHPLIKRSFTNYIKKRAPEKYHDKLVPTYTLGCKRIIFDADWLQCLHNPNMSLNWDGVQSIEEDGIVTGTGEKINFDTMIFATGYVTDDIELTIRGTKETLKQYYDRNDGPKAYLGSTVPGFPNMFVVCGPNTTTGNTSIILFEEIQADYAMQLFKPVISGAIRTFDVTDKATDDYNAKIHARLQNSVFTSCVSWYRRGREGKVSAIFPGAGTLFWWWMRTVNWAHYTVTQKKRGAIAAYRRKEMVNSMGRWILWMLKWGLVGVLVTLVYMARGVRSQEDLKGFVEMVKGGVQGYLTRVVDVVKQKLAY